MGVPTTEEQELLKNWHGTETKQLAMAERFVYELKDIELYELKDSKGNVTANRLKYWQFKLQFDSLCSTERPKVELLQSAYICIKNSDSFKQFLQYVLLIGNYMNYEHKKKGNVDGFELKSLLNLESSKSVNKKESLLTFIIKQCKQINPKSLEFADKFNKHLSTILQFLKSEDDENKIDITQLGQKIAKFGTKRNELKHSIQNTHNDDDDDMFEMVMNEFLDDTKEQYDDLVNDHQKVIDDLINLGVYFGQKKDPKLGYLNLLLEFSKSLKSKQDEMNKNEERQRKAAEKKKRTKVRFKGNDGSSSQSSKKGKMKNNKKKGNDDKLIELYRKQRKDKQANTDNSSLSTKNLQMMDRRKSITMDMLERVNSDEIHKRRSTVRKYKSRISLTDNPSIEAPKNKIKNKQSQRDSFTMQELIDIDLDDLLDEIDNETKSPKNN